MTLKLLYSVLFVLSLLVRGTRRDAAADSRFDVTEIRKA